MPISDVTEIIYQLANVACRLVGPLRPLAVGEDGDTCYIMHVR